MRQVELIEPRVIATLGNFATKLLTGSRAGITRVRGTPQVHEMASRTVFLMPLLHPAAALRTPSLVETLRQDFRALAELIEQAAPPPARPVEAEREPEPDQLGLFG
jgi:DNA polymerase